MDNIVAKQSTAKKKYLLISTKIRRELVNLFLTVLGCECRLRLHIRKKYTRRILPHIFELLAGGKDMSTKTIEKLLFIEQKLFYLVV